MVVVSTEDQMMVQELLLENGTFTLGFLERDEYVKRSEQEGFQDYIKECKERVECLFVVPSFLDCKEICQRIFRILEEPGLMNIDAADLCMVSGYGAICCARTESYTTAEELRKGVQHSLTKTYAKKDRSIAAVLLSIAGNVDFMEASEAGMLMAETLGEDIPVLFEIQEEIQEGKIEILMLVAEV